MRLSVKEEQDRVVEMPAVQHEAPKTAWEQWLDEMCERGVAIYEVVDDGSVAQIRRRGDGEGKT